MRSPEEPTLARYRPWLLAAAAYNVVWGSHLPLAFGLTIVTNDLIWLPAFIGFARDAARLSGGWRSLLSGD